MNHLGKLRISLLLAIGAVPVACGGTVQHGDSGGQDPDSGSGGSSGGGSSGKTAGGSGKGGGTPRAGGPAVGSGGTGSGGGTAQAPCTNPKLDTLSGLVYCDEGYRHRPQSTVCSGFGGAAAEDPAAGGQGGSSNQGEPIKPRAPEGVPCGTTTMGGSAGMPACSQYDLGYCAFEAFQVCKSGCFDDQDCGPGYLCECGHAESPSGGECVQATCIADSDCDPGFYCAPSFGACGTGPYACQTPQDECVTNEDCMGACDFDGKRRVCNDAVCGRPFIVEAAPRLAPVATSASWRDEAAPRIEHLTLEQRRQRAEHWTALARMEHASIAAFARFQLQLLALAAPPELVECCTRALADETAHTRLCFGIASAYAGRPLGPGPLDISRSLEPATLCEIVELVIAEGCLGETRAALEARQAADAADDPVIAAAYTRIAEDEQRHAELAFRFVRWALARDNAVVRSALQHAIATMPREPAALGITLPCLRALLETAPPLT